MNLLTSLALLGFVSRNIAMPIVLMQLPEGTDPKKLNGTMFMIPGDGEEFVGPPGGQNRSLTVVVLPTEALNGLDLTLPGLSGRRNFLFGNKNGIQTKIIRKILDPRELNSTITSSVTPLAERSNNFDPKDVPFVEDWNRSSSGQDPTELDINYDETEQDSKETSSSPSPYAPQDEISSDDPWDIRSTRRTPGKGQKEIGNESKNKRRGGNGTKKPKKQPVQPIVEETVDEIDTEGEPNQGPNEGTDQRSPSYGSRRTVWGYPTQGQIPYPSFVSKPYPKERPRSQEPNAGQPNFPINRCSGCPSTQYPVTSQTFYPNPNGQQETFITLPDSDEYSGLYDVYPNNNYYGQGEQSRYASSVMPSQSDYPRYDSAEALLTSSDSSSLGGSLLELPFRSRIPSLLNTPSTETSLSPSSSQPPTSYYPMPSLADGRGQVSGYYIQTRPAQSQAFRNILERLINDSNNRYSSDLESIFEVSTGE